LKWSRQAAEAVDFIHSKEVIHCDIYTNNLLLDSDLDIKLCDFQGIYRDLNGEAMESVRSFLPREHTSLPTVATDLFALSSAIYEIVTGHKPYEELGEAEVEERYMKRQFPDVDTVFAGEII
jgi:serine/threonine protein kinase